MTEDAEPNKCPDRCRVLLTHWTRDRDDIARELSSIAALLPHGWTVNPRPMGPLDDDGRAEIWAVISGKDYAGWTLDGYVIPRLASGNHHAQLMPTHRDWAHALK